MHTMVLEVLIAFGFCIVAEAGFLLADNFDCRRRERRAVTSDGKNRDPLSIVVR